jgi:glycosyl transferase family 25
MRITLINLARRPDRLAAMTAQAQSLGLALTRQDAVDAKTADPAAIDRHFAAGGPLGLLPRGDKACALSHRAAWAAFHAGGDAHGAFLEDDVTLAPDAARLLADASWLPAGADVVKLEHFGPESQRVLVGPGRDIGGGFAVAPLLSRHPGGAAYILSRRAAEILLALPRFNLPVDHLLFNPNNSPVFAALKPLQLLPAIARQQGYGGDASDIAAWRAPLRAFNAAYVKRELVRFGYDLKLLPRQAAQLLTGKARLARISRR